MVLYEGYEIPSYLLTTFVEGRTELITFVTAPSFSLSGVLEVHSTMSALRLSAIV